MAAPESAEERTASNNSTVTTRPVDNAHQGDVNRRRIVGQTCIATVLYLVVAVLFMRPAMSHCRSTIMGQPGDSTAGAIWFNWNYLRLGVTPFAAHTPLVAAPGTAVLWRPLFITALVWILPMWALTHAVGPVCAWNLGLLAGFVLDGLAMYGLARWLTRRPVVALVAGYAYAFTPYHIEKSYGHIAYLHTWIFPILIWAVLALMKRPSLRQSLACASALAIAFYTDGYFILLAPVTILVFAAIWILRDVRSRAFIRQRFQWLALTATLTAVLALPVLLTFATNRSQISSDLTRTSGDLANYGARWFEYLFPAHTHPIFGPLVRGFETHHLHNSNFSEQTLYVGWTVVILAVISVGGALARRSDAHAPTWAVKSVLPLATLAVVAAVFSAPPRIGPFRMPSTFVYRAIPFWRVYARFFIVVDAALVALAAIGLAWLEGLNRRRSWLPLVALPIIAFDLLATSPQLSFSYTRDSPEAYRWLATVRGNPIVAEYPLVPEPFPDAITYLTYQPLHGKRVMNGATPGTLRSELERGLFGLTDPQTLPALRALGVEYVIVHSDFYVPRLAEPPPASLTEVHASGPIRIFRLDAGDRAEQALTVGEGFGQAEPTSLGGGRWMGNQGTLHVWRFAPAGTIRPVGFVASSFHQPRNVTVTQAGRVLWSGVVEHDTRVEFVASSGPPITVRATPGVERISDVLPGSGDNREVSITISALQAGAN